MSNHVDAERTRDALVVFPGALGDFICFLPALREIARRAGRTPLLLAKETLAPLVRLTALARPHPIEAREGSWLFSASPPPDAMSFFGGFSSIECFTGHGVPEVDANLRRFGAGSARVHPFRPSTPEHLALHFLRSIGGSADELPQARLDLPAGLLEAARRRARLNRIPLLVVHPGSGGVGKRWSREGFARIASRWARERGEAMIVLGPAESSEAAFWESRGLETKSALDLVELAALLAISDAYLGNDSGASHLAAAAGARGVVLFGPTDPERWRPLSSRLRVVRPPLWSGVDERASEAMIRSVDQALAQALADGSP
ncbi:MAG: glycosyltransferase family 9 protein [Candidatus Binatia bacterium]